MARKKTAGVPDSSTSDCDRNGLDELTSTVDTLAKEVRVLREAIDELRELLDWTTKNRETLANDQPFPPVGGPRCDQVERDPSEKIHPATPDREPVEEEPSSATPGELF